MSPSPSRTVALRLVIYVLLVLMMVNLGALVDQVLQRFHAADQSEGDGIGLATVQRLVARHGGRVWAESTVGQGAVFYFTLPTPPVTT